MQLINDIAAAPKAIGPYSQAVQSGGFVFCSGQLPIDPATGRIEAADAEGQAAQVFANLKALLAGLGLGLGNVVKSTVFLQDLGDFAKINALYEAAFEGHKPARSTVQVARLPLGALVEIEVIAERS